MTTTKTETPSQEKKGDRMKKHSEKTEEEEELKPSKEKEQSHHHHPISKPPSAPTLRDSFNNSHSHHSVSEGDLQRVVASHSQSISDGAIKEVNKKSVTVMDVEDVEEGARDGVSKKVSNWHIVVLSLRIAAFVFCMIAFSVLASDRREKLHEASPNWIGSDYESNWVVSHDEASSLQDFQIHWYYLQEFKYCFSVNVIGFVYSALQIFDLVKYFITKRHTVNPKLRGYFNFAMDQVMAYLLISASSSAATTTHNLSIVLLEDKFMEIAKASVALSFVAFLAFASSSLVSAFCRFN
ncbi:hypothetical protein ACSQ67_008180 [Phaseolus vulgaris]